MRWLWLCSGVVCPFFSGLIPSRFLFLVYWPYIFFYTFILFNNSEMTILVNGVNSFIVYSLTPQKYNFLSLYRFEPSTANVIMMWHLATVLSWWEREPKWFEWTNVALQGVEPVLGLPLLSTSLRKEIQMPPCKLSSLKMDANMRWSFGLKLLLLLFYLFHLPKCGLWDDWLFVLLLFWVCLFFNLF